MTVASETGQKSSAPDQQGALGRAFSRIPWGYALRRVLIAIPTLLIIVTVAFFLMRAAPGGPFDSDRKLSPEVERNIMAKFGMDKPLHEQYVNYIGGIVTGDLGPSMRNKDKDVGELIVEGLPVSLTIGGLAMAVGLFFGTLFGILAALRQNTAADYSVMTFAMAGISIPTFVTGPILALVFAVWLGWFSPSGLEMGRMTFYTLFLPVVTLALPQIAIISRLMRASMIEVLRSNYIRTARSKGLDESDIIMRHALPAAILPLISYLGPATAGLITGSVVIERVFSLPGIGAFFVDGAINRDYTLVMGVVILYASLILLLNLIADILYGVLDPKVRYE
jgi:oligopeptide transport system permease protein